MTATQVTGTMVEYPGDGVTMKAYLALPSGEARRPAVIIVQEWWGLTDLIKDVAQRFAREGYVAIAPDLYSRLGHTVTTDPGEASRLMNALKQEDGLKDLKATIAHLTTLPRVDARKIGVVGFCMGGSYALMLPCVTQDIKAAVPFYGWVPNPDTPIKNLACPILYLYGEDDALIPMSDVRRLSDALTKYHKPGEVKTYPGVGHAFCRDTDPSVYRPTEAADAWARTWAFFKQQLA